MFDDNVRKIVNDGWTEHSDETGHTNMDSDDDYEIRCRECLFVVSYSQEAEVTLLRDRVTELEEREEAFQLYMEQLSEDHEAERAKTILNANKVRRVAAKIARERTEAQERVKALEAQCNVWTQEKACGDCEAFNGHWLHCPSLADHAHVVLRSRLHSLVDEMRAETREGGGSWGEPTTEQWVEKLDAILKDVPDDDN